MLATPEYEVRHEASSSGWQLALRFPVLGLQHQAVNQTVDWLLRLLGSTREIAEQFFANGIANVLTLLQKQAPYLAGNANFLEEAIARNIPWQHVCNNVYQYGWGSRARLLDGSFTESTPHIATRIARHKLAAAHTLRTAGLPVPRQYLVATCSRPTNRQNNFSIP